MLAHTLGYKRPPWGHHARAVELSGDPLRPGVALPSAVDLRPNCPEVYDQGSLGSCTAHALVGGVAFLTRRQQIEGVPTGDPGRPSRLGLYYDERNIEGTISDDAGAVLSDGVHVLATRGWRLEKDWPYDVARFADSPAGDYLTQRLTGWVPLPHDVDLIREDLAEGYPVVFGTAVFQQIQETATGDIDLPVSGDVSIGGHAMLIVGYDDATQRFRVRNSWGSGWGDRGYGTIPYAYIADAMLTDEIYAVQAVRPL